MAELTPKTINELPQASSWADTDLFPASVGGSSKKITWGAIKAAILGAINPLAVANGGTGATNWKQALANLHFSYLGVTEAVTVTHYGGDNGVQIHIYGSDNTVYLISFLINAIQLHTSADGGATWVMRWSFNV